MIIDAHAHVGGGLRDLCAIKKTLESNGIDRIVLTASPTPVMCCLWVPGFLSWLCLPDLVFLLNRVIRLFSTICRPCRFLADANRQVFEYQQALPDKIVQFYWYNPTTDPGLVQLTADYQKWRFSGIKLNQGTDPFGIDARPVERMAGFAAEKGLPVFIHLYQREDIAGFIDLAHRNPQVTFITGHMIGMEEISLHRNHVKNIYIEISPPWLHSRERLLRAINWFGAERVVFGSDTPFGCRNIDKTLRKVNKLPISEAQKNQILGENMAGILKLDQEEL